MTFFSFIVFVSVNKEEWSAFRATAGPPSKAYSKKSSTKQKKSSNKKHYTQTSEACRTNFSIDGQVTTLRERKMKLEK